MIPNITQKNYTRYSISEKVFRVIKIYFHIEKKKSVFEMLLIMKQLRVWTDRLE